VSRTSSTRTAERAHHPERISNPIAPDDERADRDEQDGDEEVGVKLIIAIIKPFKIDEVTQALHELAVPGVTLTEVRGYGRQRGHTEVYRGAEYKVDYLPKLRLELLVDDGDADKVARGIADAARTGTIGDGKVWILDVAEALRIRTGELGPEAI
jgi:nitrogen regulatory protein P-II 1